MLKLKARTRHTPVTCFDYYIKIIMTTPLVDLHTHTVASGHAYCTVNELVEKANIIGLEAIAITDHGPRLPNGPHIYHFSNQERFKTIPGNCKVLSGVEEDIAGPNGEVFLPENTLNSLEVVLVGLHPYPNGWANINSKKNVLISLLKAMENPLIKGVTHPISNWFDFSKEDIIEIVENAESTSTAVELNLSKIYGLENKLFEFLDLAGEFNAPLMINSDAHAVHELGDFSNLEKFTDRIIPENVINKDYKTVKSFFEIER